MQAPMSMCLICRNEEATLENCLKSIRPYVAEIVVVDTGSTDKSPEIAKRYADKWETFTACNDEQGIFDFSMARNRSFELASYDIISWMDGDDEIVGAENFSKYIERLKGIPNPHFVQFPYEYSYDANGNCSLRHYRERLFFKTRGNFHWVNPVHEVSIPKPQSNQPFSNETADDIIWKHKRQFVNKIIQPNRNLRILKKWYDQHGDSDARQLYYLGLEYGNVGDVESSKKFLNRYLELSGWPDECYMALLRLMEYGFSSGDYEYVVDTAFRAVKIKPDWGEAYFNCSKAHYFLANSGKNESENWKKCIDYARIGLSLPETKTLLFVNPNERNVEIHKYLNLALSKVGRIEEAINSINSALRFDPENKDLLLNKKIFEDYQMRDKTVQSLEALQRQGVISPESKEKIFAILANTINDAPKIEETKPAEIADQKEPGMNWKPYHRPEGYPHNASENDRPTAVITPHSQAWGIPESFVYGDLPLKTTEAQLISMIYAVWSEYMLHDELVSAISLLENAPTRIRHSDSINTLLRKTKKMVAWIDNEEEYDRHNAATDFSGELLGKEMIPLPAPLTGAARLRWNLMGDRMPDKNKTILDLACIDGEFSNRWGMEGRKVVGIDCCSHSIKIANEAAEKHKTGVKHMQSYFNEMDNKLNGEKFDYISCGDVYEHLKDPVADLLKPARAQIKENGKMLLVCPHQSWTRGVVNMNMHPWLWAREGENWLTEKNRAHVIAPTVWTTAKHFQEAGWYVYDCVRVAQWFQEVPDQGNVLVEAYPNPPKSHDTKDIVIFMGDGLETITPHTIDLTGIGGSELAVREMSKRFAAEGHRVRVFAGCGVLGEGIYQGVEWYETQKFHDLSCDVLIASRQASALDPNLNVKAKLRCLWVHDLVPKGLTEQLSRETDIIFALSHWHKQFMLDRMPFLNRDKIVLSGNGIDFVRFDEQKGKVVRNPHKMIISSSPDRYLASFIKAWSKIKKKVPDAEAVLCYGFFNWERSAQLSNDVGQLNLIKELQGEVAKLESAGVKMLGRLNQNELAKEFLSSGVWGLPSWFDETNCIGLSEAMSAGCAQIVSNKAALGERGVFAAKIDGDWLSPEYIQKFADEVVKAMLGTTQEQRQKFETYARQTLSWDMFAGEWQKLFDDQTSVPLSSALKLNPYTPLMDRS